MARNCVGGACCTGLTASVDQPWAGKGPAQLLCTLSALCAAAACPDRGACTCLKAILQALVACRQLAPVLLAGWRSPLATALPLTSGTVPGSKHAQPCLHAARHQNDRPVLQCPQVQQGCRAPCHQLRVSRCGAGARKAAAAPLSSVQSLPFCRCNEAAERHATNFTSADLALVDRLLCWPPARLFPALDVARLVALDPKGAAHLAAGAGACPHMLPAEQCHTTEASAACRMCKKCSLK